MPAPTEKDFSKIITTVHTDVMRFVNANDITNVGLRGKVIDMLVRMAITRAVDGNIRRLEVMGMKPNQTLPSAAKMFDGLNKAYDELIERTKKEKAS